LSKVTVEVDDHLDIEVGDSVIVIKADGSLGKVILPEMSRETQQTEGYKKMLKVLDLLKPGAEKDFKDYNRSKLH
jgi:bifunctional DNA-binding transcriptional regulator/antitoxin component of YhaV-PrlF toxin-antitoxin module